MRKLLGAGYESINGGKHNIQHYRYLYINSSICGTETFPISLDFITSTRTAIVILSNDNLYALPLDTPNLLFSFVAIMCMKLVVIYASWLFEWHTFA